jgi:hypothetical protein
MDSLLLNENFDNPGHRATVWQLSLLRSFTTVASTVNDCVPILPVKHNLVRIELPVKSSMNLGVTMAIKAQYCEILLICIAGVLIDVVNLDWFAELSANTTRAVG